MRVIFSRKGFDSSAGGGPSPIVDGRPLSLPIPDTKGLSRTTYAQLGLAEHAVKASRGRVRAHDLCHHDPMFLADGTCAFGQTGAAQTHLERQGVGVGDVFIFFGLFADEHTGELHHRIFGYLKVEEVIALSDGAPEVMRALGHPHALGMHGSNDVIWLGEGRVAMQASHGLRLSVDGGPPSLWHRPDWLRRGGLSYHDRADRWIRAKDGHRRLKSVARGQEFVADIGRRTAPREWLERMIADIRA
ncbi:MAG: hypothetical protein AAFY47_10990 [Pseudomonadota bacterium]